MTGRALYDAYCKAHNTHIHARPGKPLGDYSSLRAGFAPVSWWYLPFQEGAVWNELAARLTPKPKKRA